MDKNTTTHTVDAQGKKLGRIASEISALLMGKRETSFRRNKFPSIKVRVIHVSHLFIGSEKLRTKEYTRYTGYPGGLKKESLGSLVKRRGYSEALRRAVYGMLPSNKLRNGMMKNLFISDQ